MKVGLQWPQTEAGQMAAVDCGPKAAGLAYWTCSIDGKQTREWLRGRENTYKLKMEIIISAVL